MPVPVRFYFMTAEEYDRLRKELKQGPDGAEEAEERKRALEGGIFFIEDRAEDAKKGKPHEEGEDGSTK